jgi:hypothetical protein
MILLLIVCLVLLFLPVIAECVVKIIEAVKK